MVKLSTKSFRKSRESLMDSRTDLDSPISSKYYVGAQNGYNDVAPEQRESSDSESEVFIRDGPCTTNHDIRQIASIYVDINIDEVFTMMFTNSKFVADMNEQRNISEFNIASEWRRDPRTNLKSRQITFTLPLSGLGPKESYVTETHTMTSCSQPGVRYSVDIMAENVGVPYADSFNVLFHNCLERLSNKETRIDLFGEVKFKKQVWGMVKGLIEKPTMSNLETYAVLLEKTLTRYAEASPNKSPDYEPRKPKRTRSTVSDDRKRRGKSSPKKFPLKFPMLVIVLGLLIAINCQLYLILKQEDARSCKLNMEWEQDVSEDDKDSMDDYIELMNEFTARQKRQLLKIKQMLLTEIETLRKTEKAISTMIEKLEPPPKPWKGAKRQFRKLISIYN